MGHQGVEKNLANTKERAIIDNWEFILSRWASAPVNPAPARHPARPGGGQYLASPPADAEIEEKKMTLTNYWWLLIWLFTGGLILVVYNARPVSATGKTPQQWNWMPAILLMLPYILWTAFRSDQIGDTGAYRKAFAEAPTALAQIPEYLAQITKDKGFYLMTAGIKCLFGSNDVLYFFLVAAFQLLVLVWLYRKYSCNYWLSIFLLVASTDFISWAQNGMRQFMAITIALLATPFMIKRKYIPAILLIVLASVMHQSALLMLLFMVIAQGKAWSKKTIVFLLATLVAITFVGNFTTWLDEAMQETQYANMVTDWTEWNDDGTNPVRVLVYAVPTILSLVGLQYIRREDDPVINFCTNMSIISTGVYLVSMATSGIFIGRLPAYASFYNYILLPWEIRHCFTKESAQLLTLATVVAYCGFFYYQMHFSWGLI